MLSQEEVKRYSRQILIPELGREGQEKLKHAKVLVIGAGGLGSPILLYLAAAGVGNIGLIDFDRIDESNLQRQILFTTNEVGLFKAEIARNKLKALNPLIEVEAYLQHLNSGNVLEILSRYDLVMDGSDNLATRYLVNDACVIMEKPLVYGAIFQFEGQVSVFNFLQDDGIRGPNYRDLFPQPPPPELVPSCSEGGVLGVLPGIIGSMMANEAIKMITGIGKTLSGKLMIFDSFDFTSHRITIKVHPDNPVTGKTVGNFTLIDYEAFCNPRPAQNIAVEEISAETLQSWIQQGKPFQLIDVREKTEFELVNLGGLNIPLSQLKENIHLLKKDTLMVIHCKSGQRSMVAARQIIQDFHFEKVCHLKGGLLQWKEKIAPEMDMY